MSGPKTKNIESLFNSIAPNYDRLNHILSFDIDKIWRRKAIKEIPASGEPMMILDIACGTGDFSMAIARNSDENTKIAAIDISENMLAIMYEKIVAEGCQDKISAGIGNCEHIPYDDCSFDCATIAFGIRNFENREACLKEIVRVLKPGGKLIILELSVPENKIIGALYKVYLTKFLPIVGGLVSGNRSAYKYLPASILKFPPKDEWLGIMRDCGYSSVSHRAFSLGICRMYSGIK